MSLLKLRFFRSMLLYCPSIICSVIARPTAGPLNNEIRVKFVYNPYLKSAMKVKWEPFLWCLKCTRSNNHTCWMPWPENPHAMYTLWRTGCFPDKNNIKYILVEGSSSLFSWNECGNDFNISQEIKSTRTSISLFPSIEYSSILENLLYY